MVDQFVIFPVNENGIFLQPATVLSTLTDAMSEPFAFGDVIVQLHGWWISANSAMIEYSQYSTEFRRNLIDIAGELRKPPGDTLGLGIHWPSILSEDDPYFEQVFRPISYYGMEARAQQVGSTGLYAALMVLIKARLSASETFSITLIGHSFGCNVICSALQRLCTEVWRANVDPVFQQFVLNLNINVILLQAAFRRTQLDAGGDFDSIAKLPNLQLLVTTSQLDRALNFWFTVAEDASNIVNPFGERSPALGAGIPPVANVVNASAPGGGPTKEAIANFNAVNAGIPVQVHEGFRASDVPPLVDLPAPPMARNRMLVADLTYLHSERIASGKYAYDPISGCHSDIANTEVYNLIAGFCF